jgi:hypothetical protein
MLMNRWAALCAAGVALAGGALWAVVPAPAAAATTCPLGQSTSLTTYKSPGTYTCAGPAGYHILTVTLIGAGSGGGGGGVGHGGFGGGGGGGGAGSLITCSGPYHAGRDIVIKVGAGGRGGRGSTSSAYVERGGAAQVTGVTFGESTGEPTTVTAATTAGGNGGRNARFIGSIDKGWPGKGGAGGKGSGVSCKVGNYPLETQPAGPEGARGAEGGTDGYGGAGGAGGKGRSAPLTSCPANSGAGGNGGQGGYDNRGGYSGGPGAAGCVALSFSN